MKKFIIRDEGKEYEVEEVETKKDEEPAPTTEPTKDESLTSEEIAALKKLAGSADKLIAMVEKVDSCDEDEDEDKDDFVDEDEGEDDDDKVVDTDEDIEKMKLIKKDSKTSIGAIQRKVKNNDSFDTHEQDVESAWAKRYGGNK